MRRIISIILFITILFSLSGCDNVATTEYIDPVEQTNTELLVYLPSLSNYQLQEAIESFQKKYSEIKLVICDEEYYAVTNDEEMRKKISA
ncbi:MAG: hypothetical protein WAX04_05055, partial [Oscillospiraceae bacterium]